MTPPTTTSGSTASARLFYPVAPQDDCIDDYHGVKVADPYRPLEDLDAPQTRAWIDAQVALTDRYLAAIPARDEFRKRLTELIDYPRRSVPMRYGDRYLYAVNSGLQNQSVWYQSPSLDAPGTVLLDPNALSADGTIAVGGFSPTLDGTRVAYALQVSGSDWNEWHVRRTSDASDLPDVVKWSKFSSAAWLRDGSGFYYCRFAAPDEKTQFKEENVDQQVYFHKLGTAQSQDALVYARPDDPHLFFAPSVSYDGRYLIVGEVKGSAATNAVLYRDLGDPAATLTRLVEADAKWEFIHNVGTRFYFRTDKDAPRGKVVSIDVRDPKNVTVVVPEQPEVMQGAGIIDGMLVVTFMHDVRTAIVLYTLEGSPAGAVALPGQGSAGMQGWPDRPEAFFTYTDYTTPASIFRYDMRNREQSAYFRPHVAFDPAAFVSEQLFATSKDGTRVPMYVVYKKGLARNGEAPAILYGYGGFDIALPPGFSAVNIPWLERGGVLAFANLRGGSEYGKEWHEAGRLDRKQNVFDDFVAAARMLLERGYTSSARLAARGGSNGGLLAAASIIQHPELFGAAVIQVGVLDMLRYQRWTIGGAWIEEFGSSDDPQQFTVLLAYSPLHNLTKGTAYPPAFIMTADHDDRVFPAHSFKFAAAMQAAQAGAAPILIRIESKAGHGAATPLTKTLNEYADMYAFLWKSIGGG